MNIIFNQICTQYTSSGRTVNQDTRHILILSCTLCGSNMNLVSCLEISKFNIFQNTNCINGISVNVIAQSNTVHIEFIYDSKSYHYSRFSAEYRPFPLHIPSVVGIYHIWSYMDEGYNKTSIRLEIDVVLNIFCPFPQTAIVFFITAEIGGISSNRLVRRCVDALRVKLL